MSSLQTKKLHKVEESIEDLLFSMLDRELVVSSQFPEKIQTRSAKKKLSDYKRLQFMQFDKPAVSVGTYKIKATQKLEGSAKGTFISQKQQFRVDAERYGLPPHYKHFIFPPNGDNGNYRDVLPHIVINKSTFPWERESCITRRTAPNKIDGKDVVHNFPAWLILVLLTEDEAAKFELVKKIPTDVGFDLDDDIEKDKIKEFSFLEINKQNWEILKSILPQPDDIEYLAHTMITKQPNGATNSEEEEEEMSVLICNRLPTPGKRHTVHMLSIEETTFGHFYNKEDNKWKEWSAIRGDRQYIPSLYKWSFTCEEDGEMGYRQTLEQKVDISPFRMYADNDKTKDSKAKSYLERGFVPLPHYLRKGERTVSWYHGPLVPIFKGSWNGISVKNATSADDFLIFDETSGLLDVSYAAAWQLGRNLTLKNKRVATQIYFWRRRVVQAQKRSILNNLPLLNSLYDNEDTDSLPEIIKEWDKQLFQLKHIPFNYIFPHPSMMPEEALRFVRLDMNWLYALRAGVFSVGQQPSQLGDKEYSKVDFNTKIAPRTGILLRSRVVEDYPDLNYVAYHQKPENLEDRLYEDISADAFKNDEGELVISHKLANDIQLCLYSNNNNKLVEVIDIFGKPRGRHFGVIEERDKNNKVTGIRKRLRKYDEANPNNHGMVDERTNIKINNENIITSTNCVNITELVTKMEEKRSDYSTVIKDPIKYNSANFAFHMIEGTPKVRMWVK